MIYDQLSRIDLYRPLSSAIARGIDFVKSADLNALAVGRHEVDGERVYAVVFDYDTSAKGTGRWETHRRYIDLQLLIRGEETILVGDVDHLVGATDYDPAKDARFYESAKRSLPIVLVPGVFSIFFPHDGHRATLAVSEPAAIRKLVVKIAVG